MSGHPRVRWRDLNAELQNNRQLDVFSEALHLDNQYVDGWNTFSAEYYLYPFSAIHQD